MMWSIKSAAEMRTYVLFPNTALRVNTLLDCVQLNRTMLGGDRCYLPTDGD